MENKFILHTYKNYFESLKGGLLAKSRKLFFSGEVIFRGQNPKNAKMQKKISKIFIVPNRSLGHTDHLYTYKAHIEHVDKNSHFEPK